MCGIAGVVNFKGYDESHVRLITKRLAHRGPDQFGFSFDKFCGLGHRRLSVIDLSNAGRQPMSSRDGQMRLVFNGEIYNYKELRNRFGPENFRTATDTECILVGYEKYGRGILGYLRGMFAFAIWDEKKKELFLARDRLGKKPLYYTIASDGTFVFASELQAVLRYPGVDRAFSRDAITEYLQFGYVSSPNTIFKNIKKLPPGHFMLYGKNRSVARQYWNVQPKTQTISFDEAKSQVERLLAESVQLRLVSDVPLGAFLSGGIDSGLVVSTAAQFIPKLQTFSIGFEEKEYDESKAARMVANELNTDHHEKIVSDINDGQLRSIVQSMDEPIADSSAIPTYILSEFARKKVTVALSGDGGDEVFGGYLSYAPSKSEILASVLSKLPGSRAALSCFSGASPIVARMAELSGKTRAEAFFYLASKFGNEIVSQNAIQQRKELFNSFSTDTYTRLMYVDLKTHLPDDILIKVDRMSMKHALEVRCPFLDHMLVEYGFTLPDEYKTTLSSTKRILRSIAKERLPGSLARLPKRGFSVPLHVWVKKGAIDIETPVRNFFARRKSITESHPSLIELFKKNKLTPGQQWLLAVFEIWLEGVEKL